MTKDSKDLQYWADLMGKKPHANTFVRNDEDDKRTVERGVIEEWARSMKQEFGASIIDVVRPENDPPDFQACVNGSQHTIELVELVDEKAKKQAIHAEQGRSVAPHFEDLQWDSRRFAIEARKLINDKQRSYEKRKIAVDVLVIHSAEPWLQAAQVRQWLPSLAFKAPSMIARAHLLLDYAEEDQEHWPLIQLFGAQF